MRWKWLCPAWGATITLGCCAAAPADGLFTVMERAAVVDYWAANRYQVTAPDRTPAGIWQVRLTPQASLWLYQYQNAIGAAKAPPTVEPTRQTSGPRIWREWVARKLAYDRWCAQQACNRLNGVVATAEPPNRSALPSRGRIRFPRNPDSTTTTGGSALQAEDMTDATPPAPGPIPDDLVAAAGNPPALAEPAAPLLHAVTFDDGTILRYEDHCNVPPAYAYFRYAQGVGSAGQPITDAERAELFKAAGLTESQQHIMTAVSRLEGSFDSVNTYDTGFVSVGFIQFITSDDGRHSLATVLLREKEGAPDSFRDDFHRFGVDVTTDGILTVLDPATGVELAGPDAVRKIIDDKRLIAVFQRAGRVSSAFRIAQIKIAKEIYWPENDPVTVTISGVALTGKVSDVVRSEAGMATLFDRKVNRGSIAPLPDVLTRVMTTHRLKRLSDAAAYEAEIVAGCRYRFDFLSDKTLQQPPAAPH